MVVPHVVRNPGVSIADLAKAFEVGEKDLLEDLNQLFVSGLPPYGPGDLIDVEVEEGRVSISMADYFSRPVRLTRSEGLALYLRGKALVGTEGLEEAPALRSALEKIEKGLGEEAIAELAGRVEVEGGGSVALALATIRRAAENRERVEIDYYSASRDELTHRRIDPEHVFSAMGNWYVVAWDHLADDERMFRADRIRSVEETGETFEPRGLEGVGRPLYTRSERDTAVRLLLGPGARWVSEYYETTRRQEGQDGRLEVTMPVKDLQWLAKLVLGLGGEAVVLEPRELSDMVREQARATLSLYVRTPRT